MLLKSLMITSYVDFSNQFCLPCSGEGAYSSVYSVLRHSDSQAYALKKVKMGKLSEKEKENALNEVRILASIKHTNICAYHEAFMDESTSSLW